MVFRTSLLAAAVVTGGVSAVPLLAQSPPGAPLAITATAPEPAPGALKQAYRVRLTSLWPQEAAAPGCRNGGEETLNGTLALNPDGTYSGDFTRHTTLYFCGAHGPAATSCSLELTGDGMVAMTGLVTADGASPSGRSLRVTWLPSPGHQARVGGECADGFKQAVREMYLATPHAAEFPLTAAGTGPRTERPDSYAWKVDLD